MKKHKIYLPVIIICILIQSCKVKRMNKEANEIIGKMTLEQKIGQMIVIGIPGKSMNKRTLGMIKKIKPGGVILFGFNIKSEKQLKDYIGHIQEASMMYTGLPLFVSIDQEGGRVKRITDGVTQFPGNMAAGVVNEPSLVYKWGRILGMELRKIGVNMNFAPVLDVNNNPHNPVINSRSFGSNERIVSKLGRKYIKGIQESFCIAVGKHFPGHGDTNKDSHKTLPVINFKLNRLKRIEFPPFIEAIDEGCEGIMTAHISFPRILKNNVPATISEYFLSDVLRKEMNFKGLVITDAMEMKAISRKMDIGIASVKSIKAGADIVLLTSYGGNAKKIYAAIRDAVQKGEIPVKRIDESLKRLIEIKVRYKIAEYKKGKISIGKVKYGKEELKLLKDGESVNKSISRGSLYYRGDSKLLSPGFKGKRIIFSKNKILRDYINIKNNYSVLPAISGLMSMKVSNSDNAILFYHVGKLHSASLKRVISICKKRKINLVILSTGNPFPLIQAFGDQSALFSFSHTEESLRQVALCINGKFKPKSKINFYMGVDDTK
ncbi:beta-N-acetylhexosaminidase [Spirochaetota bacterium]